MKRTPLFKKRPFFTDARRKISRVCFVLLPAIFVAGCVGVGKPPVQIARHLISYPPPVFEKLPPRKETIRMERFSIAAAYNTQEMIFRGENAQIDSFHYNRWAANPADMVGDVLLRDMQQSGFFRAVFSRYAIGEGHCVLHGGIQEFFLRMGKTGRSAVISLEITLIDARERDTSKRVLMQKNYHEEASLESPSPEGYCRAMSQAVETVSHRIAGDVHQRLKR